MQELSIKELVEFFDKGFDKGLKVVGVVDVNIIGPPGHSCYQAYSGHGEFIFDRFQVGLPCVLLHGRSRYRFIAKQGGIQLTGNGSPERQDRIVLKLENPDFGRMSIGFVERITYPHNWPYKPL